VRRSPLHMGVKGRFIRVGLMEIEVRGICFILNGLEPEGSHLVPQALTRMIPKERDERVHMLWLDGELCQYAVDSNLLRRILIARNADNSIRVSP